MVTKRPQTTDYRLQAGRFFILGFDGTTMPASLKNLAVRHGLGGVILFDRNIESPQQVGELTKELRSLSKDAPLLISIDQEGGNFQRLKPPRFGKYPPACEVTNETACDVGKKMGQELARLGINMDNAPVMDVNTNPENPIIGVRSFGADPQQVTEIGRLFIQGLQENGILACGKHFPGHGDTSQDSHLTLPVVEKSREALEQCELHPFKSLIHQYIQYIDTPTHRHIDALQCLMTAHVLYPAVDPSFPATFSRVLLTDLLRKEWGYEGLVITDDLGMVGALSQADLPEACIQAFSAGCDLLLVCEHLERHEEIIEALEKAIGKSPALQKRAEESLIRIRKISDTIPRIKKS